MITGSTFIRALCLMPGALSIVAPACAQEIDSVHVFQWQNDGRQTATSANRLVWQLHREQAPHTTLKGEELSTVNDAVKEYKPSRQVPSALPDLAHVAMVFSRGRTIAFGVTDDLERLINLTSMREYHISTWSEHVYVRALMTKLLVVH